MRWLFSITAMCIAVVYYLGIKEQEKDMEEMGKSFTSFVHALTGRNAIGTFASYPADGFEVEEETPYYFPPGQPKEELYHERY